MKYYASDIIRKARIAADLVNSDFINWYEEVSLLNDTYRILYQDLVETNDPAFVKVLETTDKVIQLPDDFYQLRCVTLVRNGFSTPILRRSFSESYNSMSYEILDNELHVNTPYVQSPPDGIYHIEYFADPITLLFPPKKKVLENFACDNKIICSNDKYIVKYEPNPYYIDDPENEQSKFLIYDYDNNLIYTSEWIDQELTFSAITDSYLIIKTESTLVVFNLNNMAYSSTQDASLFNVVIVEDGSVYLINDEKEIFSLDNTNTAIRVMDEWPIYLDNDLKFSSFSAYFTDNTWQDCWYVDADKTVHFDEEVLYESGANIILTQPVYRNGCLYGKSSYNFITINGDNTYYIKHIPSLQSIGVLNPNTGLSLISNSSEHPVLEPWVNDILLNYPNSFFFQTMVYALAVQYKITQGADASGLQAIYNGYHDQFIRSVPQDVYMPSRINNVYTF